MFHTFEQAKLKPVQALIWKRFLTNRVEHTDGRVFVTAKDARLPKLSGPVSVKDTEEVKEWERELTRYV